MKEFKDQLDQCLLYAIAYNQREKLEGSFGLDLAKRLPFEAKQRYLEFLLDKCGSTSEPTYQSLVNFVKREELCKSTDFGIMLLGERQSHQENKKFDKNKATCRVRQTTAKSNESHPLTKSSDSAPVYRAGDSRSPTSGGARNAPLCIYCSLSGKDQHHWLSNCRDFLHLNPKDRRDVVMKSGKCLNCLRDHFVKDCTRDNNCRRCGNACDKKHYFLLHDYFVDSGHRPPETSAEPAVTVRSVKIESVKAAYNRVTAARVMNPATGHSKLVYCQHDPRSQLTFIASSSVEDLGLEPFDTASFKLDTLVGDKNTSANLVKFNIQSIDTEELFGDESAALISPWVDDVETLLHKQDLSNLQHFDGVKLVTLDNCDTVDIIIGNDNAFLMCTKEERMGESRGEPHAIFTPLGWMASGGRSPLYVRATKVLRVQTCVANDDLSQCKLDLEARDREIAALKGQLRDLAVQNEALDLSRTDEIAKGLVEPNVKLCDDHFEIPLPLKADIELPNNLALARDRAIALRKKALKQHDLCEFLVETMQNLKSNGYIEKANESVYNSRHEWYLPYFVTSQAKKRIVYDGKSEYKGVCVNDVIMTGPDLLNPIVHVLARFRKDKYALMADITKCFFQIKLPVAQRDLCRLLWFENDDVHKGKLVLFRFCVHPWGIKSSPYIACLAIKKMVEQNPSKASDLTLGTVSKNMYVDDFIFSADSFDDAQQIANEAIALFRSRGFELVKWSANKESVNVLVGMDSELLAPSIREVDLETNSVAMPSAKTLGCVWVTESDELRIQCSLKPLTKYTRRSMLSQLGKKFDLLAFGSPFFLKARLILQQLAIEKFDRDEEVPESVVKEWEAWLHSLEMLKDFSLLRWYFLNADLSRPDDNVEFQLHGFSDASNLAFSSVIYLRRLVNGIPVVSFVFGKCNIVLANQSSWPIARKELVAALNTAKLLKQASDALEIPNCSNFFWCDSRTVLQWLKNPDLRLNKFIRRRVNHILMLSSETEWRFCPSKLNAADVGLRPDLMRKAEARDLWINGPSLLQQYAAEPLVENVVQVGARRINLSGRSGIDGIDKLIEKAPNLYTLQKRVAYLIAFVDWFQNCKVRKNNFIKPVLNAAYLETALLIIVKLVQNKVYGNVICSM